jgi:hypothetical protein
VSPTLSPTSNPLSPRSRGFEGNEASGLEGEHHRIPILAYIFHEHGHPGQISISTGQYGHITTNFIFPISSLNSSEDINHDSQIDISKPESDVLSNGDH